MSAEDRSSGEEGSLCIDTGGHKAGGSTEKVKRKGSSRGKGKGKRGGGGGGGVHGQDPDPKPGDVVWAKVMGFNFWPAKIFDAANDDMVPVWLKQPPKPSYILVRFFGTYDMYINITCHEKEQWVSPSSIESYNKGLHKKFQYKSRSKIFQKAVKEVFAYVEDSVTPEGLTLRPPDPSSDEDSEEVPTGAGNGQDSEPPGSASCVVTSESDDLNNTDNHFRGSARRKSATPHRRSSSSSDSQPKRPRLDSSEEGKEESDRLLSPEVEAFTCAPLPLAPSDTKDSLKVTGGNESSNESSAVDIAEPETCET